MPVSPRINRLYDDFRAAGPGAVEAFWNDVTASGTPIVEPLDEDRVVVTFVWRGDAESTTIGWELGPNQAMANFVTRELMPWTRRRWSLSDNPDDCVIAGSSLGGLTAAYIALRAPEVFAAVISQSGSFWWPKLQEGEPGWLIREYAKEPRKPLRFYLDVGNRETQVYHDGVPDQLSINRRMRDTLLERGYPVTYAEFTGGHDYINWRRTFADGLLAVLPAAGSGRNAPDHLTAR